MKPDEKIPERIPPETAGSNNEIPSEDEVASYIRESVGTTKKELQRYGEKLAAFEYAKKHNIWIDDLYSLGSPFSGGGNENTLAYNEKDGFIYKSNNLSNHNDSILELFDSIKYHNEIFQCDKYEFVGFTGHENKNREPYIEPIFKQFYIQDSTQAYQEEIEKFMRSIGFTEHGKYSFKNEKYIVSDLRPRNVLKDEEGNICVIDDIVKLNMEEKKECIKASIVYNDLDASIQKFKEKFSSSFKGIHRIESLNIDVIINSTSLGEIMKSVGLHKMNAFLLLDELIKKAVFDKEDKVKEKEVKFIERSFWVKNCVIFKEDDSVWDFHSLIKKQKSRLGFNYVYYGTLKIRKD